MDALLLSHLVSGNQSKEKFTSRNRYVENDSARNRYYYLDDVNDFENDIRDNINKRLQQGSQEKEKESVNYGFKMDYATILNNMVGIIISTISAYLAWTCNSKLAFGRRVAFTILAFLFGMFYLVYAISFITSQCGPNN